MLCGREERGGQRIVRLFHVSVSLRQDPHDVDVATLTGKEERRRPAGIFDIELGAAGNKLPHYFSVACKARRWTGRLGPTPS